MGRKRPATLRPRLGRGGGHADDAVEFLVWHETYHMGQALLYRRAAGLASPIG